MAFDRKSYMRTYMRRYTKRPEERLKISERDKRLRKKDPNRCKAKHLKYRYGITLNEYHSLFAENDGRCAICERPAQVIDHCHKTGKVRAALCINCNRGLGAAFDSPEILRKMALYLEGHV